MYYVFGASLVMADGTTSGACIVATSQPQAVHQLLTALPEGARIRAIELLQEVDVRALVGKKLVGLMDRQTRLHLFISSLGVIDEKFIEMAQMLRDYMAKLEPLVAEHMAIERAERAQKEKAEDDRLT